VREGGEQNFGGTRGRCRGRCRCRCLSSDTTLRAIPRSTVISCLRRLLPMGWGREPVEISTTSSTLGPSCSPFLGAVLKALEDGWAREPLPRLDKVSGRARLDDHDHDNAGTHPEPILQSAMAILGMNVSLYILNYHSRLHFHHSRRLIELCPSPCPPHRRPPLLCRQNCWGYNEERRDFSYHSTERGDLPPRWVFSDLPSHACTSPIQAAICR